MYTNIYLDLCDPQRPSIKEAREVCRANSVVVHFLVDMLILRIRTVWVTWYFTYCAGDYNYIYTGQSMRGKAQNCDLLNWPELSLYV